MSMDDTEFSGVDDIASGEPVPAKSETVQPLYQVYEGSRIAVSSSVGKAFKRRLDAAVKAYEHINLIWEECFKYYNNDQTRAQTTMRGIFKRGDGTENIVFSNLNIMLPAIYSKDPDITCSTTDEQDQPFCKALQALINALFKRRDGINAKPRVKKAAGTALLTNAGIVKLTFTQKSDSREFAINEMRRITGELAKAKDQNAVDMLYGELEALEQNMEVLLPSGFSLGNVLPHNLVVDPYAEMPDGTDGTWMAERVFIATNSLTARYTRAEDGEEDSSRPGTRVLVYKPTHKAQFAPGAGGQRDDGLGVVMEALSRDTNIPASHTEDERTAYINMYFTECWYVWDKLTRRVYLFQRDDWTWPLWVWDEEVRTTRFFPYYIISFVFSTGGTISAGETAYILDQQDEINDINRQKNKIRRSIFDYFYYNTDKCKADEVEKFVKGLRGETAGAQHVLGVAAGEMKLSDVIESIAPPAAHYETLFDTKPILDSINRITNTSDALRGVQFKTNTNVASVQSYEQSMRLSVGSKVDVIEDTVADIAMTIAEIAVQQYDQPVVAGYIGDALASGWRMMDLDEFRATYALELVAGSMEKPNSVFKKKEATEVAQAIGQFAQAAPGATLRIMLRVLEQAFTEIVVKPEDWAALDQEIQANLARGNSTGAPGADTGGAPQPSPEELVKQLPPEAKKKIAEMHQQGVPEPQIVEFIKQQLNQRPINQPAPNAQNPAGVNHGPA